MHALAQRVARAKPCDQAPRRPQTGGNFEAEPPIRDEARERFALREKLAAPPGDPGETRAERRRCLGLPEGFDTETVMTEGVERDVDTIERPVVASTVLQMVD